MNRPDAYTLTAPTAAPSVQRPRSLRLITLVLAVPAATRAIADPAARTPLLSGALSRFSVVALTSVGVLIASGTAQSIVHLRSFGDLLHTAISGRAAPRRVRGERG